MEGFTPSFFLQVIIALASGVGAFAAMKADLRAMFRGLEEEKRLRELHESQDDTTHHDIRDDLGAVSTRLAMLEGRAQQ